MSFTTISTTQNEFLESYLRGTGRALSTAQAVSLYGIKNIRARMSEMRSLGLKVSRKVNTVGHSAYSIAARDCTGSRSKRFA